MNTPEDPFVAPKEQPSGIAGFLHLPNTLLDWVVIACIGLILMALLLPPVEMAMTPARRTRCKNNLKQIGLALHNYHDVYNCFPPAVVHDEHGQPAHSWRVLILPYLEEQRLYEQYRFDEPWDGPNNAKLVDSMPAFFACPTFSDSKLGDARGANKLTTYMVINDIGAAFDGPESLSIKEFTDGADNTVMVTEVRQFANIWMSPTDVSIAQWKTEVFESVEGNSSGHKNGVHILMCDGAVRFLSHDTNNVSLSALTSIAGQDDASGGF